MQPAGWRIRERTIQCLLLIGFALCASAYAVDWPQWRGPDRDGKSPETGLLKEWPQEGPKLVWTARGLGDGYASVAVVGDRIYTIGEHGETSSVLALNATDGKQAWSAKLGKSGAPGNPKFEGPRGTPSIDGNLVVAVGQWGVLACYDRTTGSEIWRKDYTKDFGGQMPAWGYAESPLIDGEKVIATPGGKDGAMAALDKKTGAVIWRSKEFTDPAHYSSAIIAEIGGVRQYIQLTPEHVAGIAAKDGALLWSAVRKGRTAVIPDPIYSDGCVYVSSGYGVGCHLFKVSADAGKFNAEQVYANKVMVNHHGGVIKVGEYLYGFSDEGRSWVCQNFKTGEAKWLQAGKLGKGCIVYADGHFILRQEDKPGTVALIEANSEGYKEHGRFEPPDRSDKKSWPHPVVANGRLYLRDQDVLLCYDLQAK
jgi:outer membrane protein assembly factor BamB